ncbi:MAG: hypothetical protein KDC66_24050 [Phaeodactylibacter sp.]|nr:hypothetical protein [Phaeodactylibacter sp.]MCB9274406.1 hypothetical protein [Lewinellaceae bacterium]
MRLLSAILLCLAGISLQAQLFSLQPGAELAAQAEPDIHNFYQINMLNETADSLALSWRNVESNYPDGWEVALCDNQFCYGLIPASGDMWPISTDEEAFLKLDVFTNGLPGTGTFRFRVYPAGEPANYQLANFVITAGLTSTGEAAPEAIKLGPNPCKEQFSLSNPWPSELEVRLFNSTGMPVRIFALPPSAQGQISMAGLPAGAYWLTGATQRQERFREIIIKL